MFTLEEIKAAHSKVKSGADFPKYAQELKGIGVLFYETYVCDGHTAYVGKENHKVIAPGFDVIHSIPESSNTDQFSLDLKNHQAGNTDYATFRADVAKNGVEKWVVDLNEMSCIYYDKSQKQLVKEFIPA